MFSLIQIGDCAYLGWCTYMYFLDLSRKSRLRELGSSNTRVATTSPGLGF